MIYRDQPWVFITHTDGEISYSNNVAMSLRHFPTHPIKHSLDVLVKATVIRQSMECAHKMAERCGAQGTFDTNYIARHKADLNSVIIAEGDVLALYIRLWGELVLGRYMLPIPASKDSLLTKHAHGLLEEARQTLHRLPGGHHSEAAEYELLPKAERAIIAQGHACTYSTSRHAGVSQVLLDLYECAAIHCNQAWLSSTRYNAWVMQRTASMNCQPTLSFVTTVVTHSATYDSWPSTRHALRVTPHGERPISVADYERTTGKRARDRQLDLLERRGIQPPERKDPSMRLIT
ncbi:hypothetical protein EI94DRAFT_1809183 [Lactarius quietus]|nr:hypothetical protein EI94DRAFT_1809183 [Lactarius quietus]